MTKYIVVAGSRNYTNYAQAKLFIKESIEMFDNDCQLVFLSGGCRGADGLGEKFATENNYTIKYFPAEWEKYGKSAGPRRNKQMADIADLVICFWNGKSRGTKSMIKFAQQANKPIKIKLL